MPAAPPAEFSITSHIRDTLWWVPPREPGQEGVTGFQKRELQSLASELSVTRTQLLQLSRFHHSDCGGVSSILVRHHHFTFLINIIFQ